ncbi:CBS domain-containing protein [Planctomycetaceae bacterium SH139]
MGDHCIEQQTSARQRRVLAARLLDDLLALEEMAQRGMLESGIRRIGAEQEFCLVDANFRPSCQGTEVLAEIDDPHFTTELALYTLELNLDPVRLRGAALSTLHQQLDTLMLRARLAAEKHGNRIILTGILPSVGMSEMDARFMTPSSRYHQLEQRIRELRNHDCVELFIQGVDDLMIRHDSILFEACNTSFQTHLQVDPSAFVDQYNWAQAIAGPVLSLATNSPLLFGRELWSETRIALFQQSVDTRSRDHGLRQRQARVYFGNRWIRHGIQEIFEEDIARYPLILNTATEDSLAQLARGEVPKLRSLALHNGTIWKWNRPCFGSDGKVAHLRLENRYLPAGPTTADEIANAAFWIGLMCGMPGDYCNLWERMDFREAKENFLRAAQHGLDVELTWLGKNVNARQLILDFLLPMAQAGLESQGLDDADITKYLGIIEHRVVKRMTGAKWMKLTMRETDPKIDLLERQTALTAACWERQNSGQVVADWKVRPLQALSGTSILEERVDMLMTTDIITVFEEDLLELVARIMQWRSIRHVPVENESGEVLGIITWTDLQRFLNAASESASEIASPVAGEQRTQQTSGDDLEQASPINPELRVAAAMVREPICIAPEEPLRMARAMMQQHDVSCLPVVRNKKLLGLLTRQDLLRFEQRS